jgi:hypothetical protein
VSCHPVLEYDDGSHQILEVDESQHFNEYRALTLRAYVNLPVAFDREAWLKACQRKTRLEGGGFARPRPPLFPGTAPPTAASTVHADVRQFGPERAHLPSALA